MIQRRPALGKVVVSLLCNFLENIHANPCYFEFVELTSEIQGAIKHCFSPDSPEESLKRLKANVTNNEIIAQTAEHMAKLDPAVVAAWYKLTRYSSTASLENALKAELTASTSL